jgi:hypothetical protein
VTRLEVRRGRSWAKRGALIGAGLGALFGSWWAADSLADGNASTGDRIRQGLLLAGAGAVSGGISGAALHPARWEPVAIDAVRPHPVASAGLALHVHF